MFDLKWLVHKLRHHFWPISDGAENILIGYLGFLLIFAKSIDFS